MPTTNPRIVLYSTEEIKKKIEFIAKENSRSTGKEIEMLIKEHIRLYEKHNGEIKI